MSNSFFEIAGLTEKKYDYVSESYLLSVFLISKILKVLD